MPKFIRNTVLLVKLEAVIGTDSVPTGAANAVQADVLTLTPLNAKTVERKPIRGYFGGPQKTTVSANMTLDIEVPLSGSGAAGTAPQWDALMQICGVSSTLSLGVSVTYAPVSNSLKTASIYVNVDGTNHILKSARGTWMSTTNAEGLPVLKFSLTGLWTPLAATALPTPTYSNIANPAPVNFVNTTLSLHAIALTASAFGVNCGAQVVHRNRIGAERVDIVDRASDFSASFENVALATKDWIAAAKANASGAISLVHGVTAGNIVTFAATKAELWTAKYGESEGVEMVEIAGGLLPTTGNDEWSLVLT